MAIGPGNKITTTGLINKQPMIPEVPVMPKQQKRHKIMKLCSSQLKEAYGSVLVLFIK